MKFKSKGLISLEINGKIYDYKLYQSLESLNRTKSQRKSAKELNISHTVFNRRILKAEDKLGCKITEKNLIQIYTAAVTKMHLNLQKEVQLI